MQWRGGELVCTQGVNEGDLKLLAAQIRSLYLCSLYHIWCSHPAVTCFAFWSAAELLV